MKKVMWPKSDFNSTELTFSGTFENSRIKTEQLEQVFSRTRDITLWLLAAISILVFALDIWQAWQTKNPYAFISHTPFNKILWLTIFSDLYLITRRKEKQRNHESDLLAHWDTEHTKISTIDVYTCFSDETQKLWNNAFTFSQKRGYKTPDCSDVFLSLLSSNQVRTVFDRLGVYSGDIAELLQNYLKLNSEKLDHDEILQLPYAAFSEAVKLQSPIIDPVMMLCAIALKLPEGHIIQDIFFNIGLDMETLEILASWVSNIHTLRNNLQLFKKLSKFKPDNEINKGLTSVPTYYLDHFSRDLTTMAKYGQLPVALGRQHDLTEIFNLVSNGRKNIIIKGAEGTGRTSLVYELAYKMASEQVPNAWQDKRLVLLEISALVGSKNKAEQVLMEILHETVKSDNVILVIEDIHTLANIQTSQGLTLLNVLVNSLEQQPITIIGTTTIEDYTESLLPEANFEQIFVTYELPPLSPSGLLLACCIRVSLLESHYNCFFSYQAIKQAVMLTDAYIKGVGQPQKAIAVLAQAATQSSKNSKSQKVITVETISEIISKKTHIPAQTLQEDETEKLLNLESLLSKQVVGQTAAISAVAESLRRARSGIASAERPTASFLFLGPTGVGKTELAKTLAKVYFGKEEYLLRLDMSEYRGAEGLVKLLGHEGAKTDTPLIRHLKNYPFCLLLVDEFEKTSNEILNIFLQILEDGRLTTGRGETLDLTHTMIIATSNAGTQQIQEGIRAGKSQDQIKTEIFSNVLTAIYPPELLNRFDGIIIFTPLSQTEVRQVTFLQLEYLRAQLLTKGIKITFTDAILADISQHAYDPTLGARPIRRYIQDHLESFIAKLLLKKKLPRGSTVTIDMVDGQLVIK